MMRLASSRHVLASNIESPQPLAIPLIAQIAQIAVDPYAVTLTRSGEVMTKTDLPQSAPVVLNLGHPFSEGALADLREHLGCDEITILNLPSAYDLNAPFEQQVTDQLDAANLTSIDWQNLPLLLIPPSLAVASPVVLAQIHGRRGSFPGLVRQVRTAGVLGAWRVAEVVDLEATRQAARERR